MVTPLKAEGLDVAEYQREFDWLNAWRQGIHFGWYKVSGGGKNPLHIDSQGARNQVESKKAGVHSQGYHFWLGGKGITARQQIDHFCKLTGKIQRGDILGMLDFEDPPDYSKPGASVPIILSQNDCRTMVQGYADYHSQLPVIYAGEAMYRRFSWFEREIEGCPRNIPHYRDSPPPPRKHDIWQYTAKGRILGHSGDIDRDRANDLHRILVP